jgi:hypothetical protein
MLYINQCKVCNSTLFFVCSEPDNSETPNTRLMCSRCNISAPLRSIDLLFKSKEEEDTGIITEEV